MAIEIVDFPMNNGDSSWQNVSSPEGMLHNQRVLSIISPINPYKSPLNPHFLQKTFCDFDGPCRAPRPMAWEVV